jgi:hypothetical protein
MLRLLCCWRNHTLTPKEFYVGEPVVTGQYYCLQVPIASAGRLWICEFVPADAASVSSQARPRGAECI